MAPTNKPDIDRYPTQSEKEDELLGSFISIGLLAGLVFAALAFGAVESWSIAALGLLVIGLVMLWMVKNFLDRQLRLVIPPIAWPLVALIVLGALQTISRFDESGRRFAVSMDVEATRLALEAFLILFFALLIFANFFTGSKRLLWFRNCLILFGLGLAVFGTLQKLTWNGKYYWIIQPSVPPSSPFASFVNHNHFAGFVEMILPIPVAMIFVRVVQKEIAIFYGFAAAMMGMAIVLSLSRWGMISLTVSLVFVVVFSLKPAMRRARRLGIGVWRSVVLPRIGAAALIVLAIGAGVYWTGATGVLDRIGQSEIQSDLRGAGEEKSGFLESRGPIWRDTLAIIRENWLTGVGLGAFETAYPIYSKSNGTVIVSQAHSDYLQIIADCGVLGGVFAIWFLIVLFRSLFQAMQHPDEVKSVMALGCGGGLVAMLTHSLFDFNLQIPSNALLFLMLSAAVFNIQSSIRKKNS
ncbi:MAG: O-antigen ligase family protein [Blastocatellia bacterium]